MISEPQAGTFDHEKLPLLNESELFRYSGGANIMSVPCANWQEVFSIVMTLIPMKYGVCQSFNLPLVQNLYKDYESLSTAFQFGSLGKIRELVMEASSELDSSRKPYSTRSRTQDGDL